MCETGVALSVGLGGPQGEPKCGLIGVMQCVAWGIGTVCWVARVSSHGVAWCSSRLRVRPRTVEA